MKLACDSYTTLIESQLVPIIESISRFSFRVGLDFAVIRNLSCRDSDVKKVNIELPFAVPYFTVFDAVPYFAASLLRPL